MIDYIKGTITELTPTYTILETSGIGYEIHIALPTFTALTGTKETILYVHEIIREDAHLLFGFRTKGERMLFLLLITVSGIGANTARMIMSSYSAAEIHQLIAQGNTAALNAIKGIGSKTSQRIIVELRDKIQKISIEPNGKTINPNPATNNTEWKEEAVAALTMLAFAPTPAAKGVDNILSAQPAATVEQVIKMALKML